MTYAEYKEECEEYGELVLPEKIFLILNRIENLFNISFSYGDVTYYNRGGYSYAKAAGFSYSVCTFSMEDGPDVDFKDEIIAMIKGLGFEIADSHGNNGLDPAESFGRDCFWHYEFAYTKSKEWLE